MEKKGQFYLIAVFVIISIISGLVYTYNYARVSEDNIDLNALAEEINYETGELINNRIFAGKNRNEIADEIRKIIVYYDEVYLNTRLKIFYGDESQAFIIDNVNVNIAVPNNGKIEDNLGGNTYEVDIRDKNYYIVLLNEKDGERDFIIK